MMASSAAAWKPARCGHSVMGVTQTKSFVARLNAFHPADAASLARDRLWRAALSRHAHRGWSQCVVSSATHSSNLAFCSAHVDAAKENAFCGRRGRESRLMRLCPLTP